MNPNQRFSILTFPQFFDGAELAVNIIVMPRNQNPLSQAIVQHLTIADAVAFADAELSFTASIFDTLAVFPHTLAPISGLPLVIDAPVNPPASPREIYSALAPQFRVESDVAHLVIAASPLGFHALQKIPGDLHL